MRMLLDIGRQSLSTLWALKLRSFLTMFGIASDYNQIRNVPVELGLVQRQDISERSGARSGRLLQPRTQLALSAQLA
jgi:hypothetical protein